MYRVFFPSKPDKTTVNHWIWKRGTGLIVYYNDGFIAKSQWTLKDLLKADHTYGDGLPCYEKKGS